MGIDVILFECNCLSFIHCIYLMHSLHHILLDYCDYLMMQSCLWQMVHTRATDDDVFDIPRDPLRVDVGVDSPSWQCTAATTSSAGQLGAATGYIE
jgi:hypothetical protein